MFFGGFRENVLQWKEQRFLKEISCLRVADRLEVAVLTIHMIGNRGG